MPVPGTDRFVAPLYAASIAALQGWDAPMSLRLWRRPVAVHEPVESPG